MDPHLLDIRNQQKESWNTFSPGWKKWDGWMMQFLQPMGEEIIRLLDLKETDHVLDVATGTGEPGLTIAEIVKRGQVTGIDISDGMLAVAEENAAKRGIANYKTMVGDVCELPFDDNTFDKISCRMGFMFFPDMRLAAKELYRVLKPGGKFATSVWGKPEKNFWVTAVMGPVKKHMQLQDMPPDAPGMFRCSPDGQMSSILREAGFKNVSEKEAINFEEAESVDFLWDQMNDVAAPMVAAMKNASNEQRHAIKEEVINNFSSRYGTQGPLRMENCSIILYGEK